MPAPPKKFEVFQRLPLPRAPLGIQPSSTSKNVPRDSLEFDTPEETLAEVAKTVAVDPSISVRRTRDDHVFHRDQLASIIQKMRPDLLEQ